ncbi:MAG: PEGA domain-containing protein, partial [Myxococcota bacterium]|nr:PEGA domain-containing protein [Myxococcota bacterium]
LAPTPATAQSTAARERIRRAVERFETALRASDPELRRRELEAALAELEEANRLESEVLIEWNLGRIEHELGRPVRALEHVERFLAGVPRDHPRRADGEALAAVLRTRVALLWVESQIPGARVAIDGEPRGVIPLSGPLRVPAGEVRVEVSAPGYRDAECRVRVAGETETRVRVDLELDAAALGAVRLRSALLDVRIAIDGEVRGTTPLERTIPLTPGMHVLVADRPGYRPSERTLEIERGGEQVIEIALEPDPDAAPGTLSLRLPDARSELRIDGVAVEARGAIPLPRGRHALALDVEEREPWEGLATIEPAQDTALAPELRWQDGAFVRRHDGAELQRTVGGVVIGAGGASLAAGLVLVLVAALDTDPREASTLAELEACRAVPSCNTSFVEEELTAAHTELDAIGTLQYGLGGGLLAVGALAAAVGFGIFVGAPSDPEIRAAAHASLRIGPGSIAVLVAY